MALFSFPEANWQEARAHSEFKSLDLNGFGLMDVDLNLAWGHIKCLPKGWVARAYNPSTLGVETGGPGTQIKVFLGLTQSQFRETLPINKQTSKHCRRGGGL